MKLISQDTAHAVNELQNREEFAEFGGLEMDKDEYIRALEMGIQLLQREVEHLRQQPRPAPVITDQRTSLSEVAEHIQSFTSVEDIMTALDSFVTDHLSIIDSGMFLPDADGHMRPVAHTSEALSSHCDHLIEEGLIDLSFDNREVLVIPQLSAMTEDKHALFAIIPLFLRGVGVGTYIVHTHASSDEISPDLRDSMKLLAESAAIAIDNVRSTDEILRMNQRFSHLQTQMAQSARMASIGELAAHIAHEINNPLQILVGHIQLLESGVGDSQRRIQIIRQQIYRISDITARLLSFARSRPDDADIRNLDLREAVQDVLSFVDAQLRRDGIDVFTDFEEKPVATAISPTHMQQVLLNIVMNARDAMPEGGQLAISVFAKNNSAVVSIADTGTGISKEVVDEIFEPYFTTKPAGKGTGVGLSISKDLIEQHNGSINCLSEEGKGTTFTISLPLYTA